MKRWQREFLDAVKSGKTPASAAATYAGLPLAAVYNKADEDEEFKTELDMLGIGEDVSDGLTVMRVLSPAALEALLRAQVPDDEAAAYFGLTESEFKERVDADPKLNRVYSTAPKGGRAILRRTQFDVAADGNKEMLKFLGQNVLGQSEKVDSKNSVGIPNGAPVTINQIFLRNLSQEQLEQLQAQALGIGEEIIIPPEMLRVEAKEVVDETSG